jgi:hypothetical protein
VRTAIYQLLKALHRRHGPKEFGKICQKFVAIAYCEAGYAHVVERGVQGVDIDAANGSLEKYALEIKTTVMDSIEFKRKDLDGLMSRCQDGYLPLLGVLRLGPLSDWQLAESGNLRVGRLCIEGLRPYRRMDLEAIIKPILDTVVEQHFEDTLTGSQAYLDRVLRQEGVEIHRQ